MIYESRLQPVYWERDSKTGNCIKVIWKMVKQWYSTIGFIDPEVTYRNLTNIKPNDCNRNK